MPSTIRFIPIAMSVEASMGLRVSPTVGAIGVGTVSITGLAIHAENSAATESVDNRDDFEMCLNSIASAPKVLFSQPLPLVR